MRPRVVRIDGRDELAKRALDTLVVRPLLHRLEGKAVLGSMDAVHEVVGRGAGDRRVRRVERQAELLDEAEVGRVRVPDHLAAELNGAAVVHGHLLDPTSDPLARLEHEHVGAAVHEIACGSKPGQASADDHDVRHAGTVSSSARMRSASAGRCAVTDAPTSYSSTSPELATSACTRSPPGSATKTCVVEPR
jgi:hypothetical protein